MQYSAADGLLILYWDLIMDRMLVNPVTLNCSVLEWFSVCRVFSLQWKLWISVCCDSKKATIVRQIEDNDRDAFSECLWTPQHGYRETSGFIETYKHSTLITGSAILLSRWNRLENYAGEKDFRGNIHKETYLSIKSSPMWH